MQSNPNPNNDKFFFTFWRRNQGLYLFVVFTSCLLQIFKKLINLTGINNMLKSMYCEATVKFNKSKKY